MVKRALTMTIVPVNQEKTFEVSELFFSRTDPRGIIEFGNDVFIRVSGHTAEKLFGTPHNIIRHPDMPRCVFFVLWNYIQAGKMIAAYVKNMAADGRFYWVLAVVFPISDGYLSIRLRPTTPLRGAAEGIYEKVLAAEAEGGMEAGAACLMQLLKGAGFPDYDSFFTLALFSEMKARDQALLSQATEAGPQAKQARHSSTAVLERVRILSQEGANRYRELFNKVSDFETSTKSFRETVHGLLEGFRGFQLISMNMAVAAVRFGEAGRTLGVIATDFQRLAEDIQKHLQAFSESVDRLAVDLAGVSREICSLKLQVDMVDFFVRESLEKVTANQVALADAFDGLEKNHQQFSTLAATTVSSLGARLAQMRGQLASFATSAADIQKFVNGLEVAKQMGAVESGRISADHHDFENYIADMDAFTHTLRSSTAELKRAGRTLVECVDFMIRNSTRVQGHLDEILELAFSLRSVNSR